MDKDEMLFLSKRAKMVSLWPIAGSILLSIVLLVFFALFLFDPFIANHWIVYSRIQDSPLDVNFLSFMASLVPILCIFLLVIILVMLALVTKSFSREKRYLILMEKVTGKPVM